MKKATTVPIKSFSIYIMHPKNPFSGYVTFVGTGWVVSPIVKHNSVNLLPLQ